MAYARSLASDLISRPSKCHVQLVRLCSCCFTRIRAMLCTPSPDLLIQQMFVHGWIDYTTSVYLVDVAWTLDYLHKLRVWVSACVHGSAVCVCALCAVCEEVAEHRRKADWSTKVSGVVEVVGVLQICYIATTQRWLWCRMERIVYANTMRCTIARWRRSKLFIILFVCMRVFALFVKWSKKL